MGCLNFERTGRGTVTATFTCANGFPCGVTLPEGPSSFSDDTDTVELMVAFKRAALTKEQAGELGERLMRFANDLKQEV